MHMHKATHMQIYHKYTQTHTSLSQVTKKTHSGFNEQTLNLAERMKKPLLMCTVAAKASCHSKQRRIQAKPTHPKALHDVKRIQASVRK